MLITTVYNIFAFLLYYMNYLAHAYLSFDKGDILVGNFIADTVKGKSHHYNEQIRKGIRLHHMIDEFTDSNAHFIRSSNRIDKKFGLYSTIIVDMFYDHFLAANWNKYHDESLSHFVAGVYKTLLLHYPILPPRMKRMLPHMVVTNWLEYYGNPNSFKLFFRGLSMRMRHSSNFKEAAGEIFRHYNELDNDFSCFMDEMIPFVRNLRDSSNNN